MKICKRCLRQYDDEIPLDYNPAQELGELFLNVAHPKGEEELCPDCREELGMMNLLGFGQ